ncbi:AI-2E family transporter [Caldimonas brevitalea]|uniref:AI-2E family transporter n=1 Tax=Caldimonas brevitalea TaxID=413882 RepID=UPI001470607F|nr:AI-2E family transporter [Caldimonas brevitalea]
MAALQLFVRQLLIAILIVALVLLVWRLQEVFVLFFAGTVAAVTLTALGAPLRRHIGFSRRGSLLLVLALLVALAVAGGTLLGAPMADQFERLRAALPQAVTAASQWLHGNSFGQSLIRGWNSFIAGGLPWASVASLASLTVGSVGTAALAIVIGIYLAADPWVYRHGFIRMLPPAYRQLVDAALQNAGDRLYRWLVGQALAMLAVGLLAATGLWAIGMPNALVLGIIAGLLEFVPYFGAIVAGALTVLLGFVEGPQMAMKAFLLLTAIQQLEGNVLAPLVQRWAVELPPVLGLLAVVIFGLLFGLAGAVLATPMMVVAVSLVEDLWVRGVLERGRDSEARRAA